MRKPHASVDEVGPETDELALTKPLPARTSIMPVQATKRLPATPALLVLLHPPPAGTRYPLNDESVTIGRDRRCGIATEDEEVSARHARLNRQLDGTFRIFDLNSTNGIQVNGRQIKSAVLKDGDVISLGCLVFRFQTLDGGSYR
jgi:pSer/pThr/pTyr-binding forkhead associated (FHA) protein